MIPPTGDNRINMGCTHRKKINPSESYMFKTLGGGRKIHWGGERVVGRMGIWICVNASCHHCCHSLAAEHEQKQTEQFKKLLRAARNKERELAEAQKVIRERADWLPPKALQDLAAEPVFF